MITFLEFRGLSPDEKNSEILKCLSLLEPLGEDFSGLKNSINSALVKVIVSKLEYDYGIFVRKQGVLTTSSSLLKTATRLTSSTAWTTSTRPVASAAGSGAELSFTFLVFPASLNLFQIFQVESFSIIFPGQSFANKTNLTLA